MRVEYATTYSDKNGSVSTVINNDGSTLTLVIRGVAFHGRDFDSLEPIDGTSDPDLSSFTLDSRCLCSCVIETEIPVPVVREGQEVDIGILTARLEIGDPRPRPPGGVDRLRLDMQLQFDNYAYESRDQSGHFENSLLDIQKQLPPRVYIRACINCAFSDYHPIGSGLFGTMGCFRNRKDDYRAVESKSDLMRIWDWETPQVQETYLCDEFERRQPNTGYRG